MRNGNAGGVNVVHTNTRSSEQVSLWTNGLPAYFGIVLMDDVM